MAFKFSPYIAFQVKNYEKAVAFYRDVVGMKIAESTPKETEFKCGDISFFVENNPQQQTFFEFEVDSIASAKTRLEKEGCTFISSRTPEGANSYMVTDPYGMKFHMFEKKAA